MKPLKGSRAVCAVCVHGCVGCVCMDVCAVCAWMCVDIMVSA